MMVFQTLLVFLSSNVVELTRSTLGILLNLLKLNFKML